MRKIVILFISFVLILTSTPVYAAEDEGFLVVMDTVVARPLGIVSLVVGTAAFVVAMPFAATSGTINKTADSLIGEPFRFTFTRPLGDFRASDTSAQKQQIKERQQSGTDTATEEKKQPENPDALSIGLFQIHNPRHDSVCLI